VLNPIRKDHYALARIDMFYNKLCKFTLVLSGKAIFNSEHIYFKILNIYNFNSEHIFDEILTTLCTLYPWRSIDILLSYKVKMWICYT
jgi:hypothetical protein